MLTKKDLEQIQKMMSNSLGDFFDKIIVPYFDVKFKENDEDHDDIFRKLDKNRNEHDRMFIKLDSIEKKVDGHEKRVKTLEKTLQTS